MGKWNGIRPRAIYACKVVVSAVILLLILVNALWVIVSNKFR